MGIWGSAPSWDKGLLTRVWMLQASPVEIIETCEESSNWYSRLLRSLVLSGAFQMPWRQKRLFINLHQVSHHGSLDDFTCFLASDTDFCSFIFHGFSRIDLGSSMHNGYLRKVLPHEIKAFLPDFGHCKCGDRWTFSRIVQLMMFKASPQCRALSYLSTAPRFKRGPSSSESWG